MEIIIISSDEEDLQNPRKQPKYTKNSKGTTSNQSFNKCSTTLKSISELETINISCESVDEVLPVTPTPNTNLSKKNCQIPDDVEFETCLHRFLDMLENETEIEQNTQPIQLFQDDVNCDEPMPIISENIIKTLDKESEEQPYTITKEEVKYLTNAPEIIKKLTYKKIPEEAVQPSTSKALNSNACLFNVKMECEENKGHLEPQKVMERDERIPLITIRHKKGSVAYEKFIMKLLERQKIQELRIIDLMLSKLIKCFPYTVFRHNKSEFSFVQIRGIVTEIYTSVSTKGKITVDDGSAAVHVVLDNSFQETEYRQKVKNNITAARRLPKLERSEIYKYCNMSIEEFKKTANQDEENKLLATLALSISEDTDRKNETQFPLVKDLNLGECVNIVGRLIVQDEGKFIYGYTMHREVGVLRFLGKE